MQKTKGIFGSFVCGAGTLDGVFQVFFCGESCRSSDGFIVKQTRPHPDSGGGGGPCGKNSEQTSYIRKSYYLQEHFSASFCRSSHKILLRPHSLLRKESFTTLHCS